MFLGIKKEKFLENILPWIKEKKFLFGIKKKKSPAPQESLDSDEAGEFYILL